MPFPQPRKWRSAKEQRRSDPELRGCELVPARLSRPLLFQHLAHQATSALSLSPDDGNPSDLAVDACRMSKVNRPTPSPVRLSAQRHLMRLPCKTKLHHAGSSAGHLYGRRRYASNPGPAGADVLGWTSRLTSPPSWSSGKAVPTAAACPTT